MQEFKLTYESSGSRNYLCMRTTEEISGYQLKMLEANEITGLLKVHGTRLNGVYCLNYDITGMGLLKNALESRSIRGDRAKRLLTELLAALLYTEEYFLSYTNCLINLDYLYLDEEQKPVLAYLPFAGEGVSSEEEVRQLYQEILAEYFDEENGPFFTELLRYVNKRGFSLAGLNKLLQDAGTKKEAGKIQPQIEEKIPSEQGKQPEQEVFKQQSVQSVWQQPEQPVRKQAEQEDPVLPKKKPDKVKAPQPEFAIPGTGQTAEINVPKKEKKQAEPEKKSGLFGKLRSGKKEEKASISVPEKQEKRSMPWEKRKTADAAEPMEKAAQESVPDAGQWRGTVMLSGDAEQGKTVMLGTGSGACLYHNSQRIELTNFPFTIGRKNGDYVIQKGVISQPHATLLKQQEQYYIKDENSSNHTYLNGKQLPPFTEYPLNSGDRIRLADEELVFSMDES